MFCHIEHVILSAVEGRDVVLIIKKIKMKKPVKKITIEFSDGTSETIDFSAKELVTIINNDLEIEVGTKETADTEKFFEGQKLVIIKAGPEAVFS